MIVSFRIRWHWNTVIKQEALCDCMGCFYLPVLVACFFWFGSVLFCLVLFCFAWKPSLLLLLIVGNIFSVSLPKKLNTAVTHDLQYWEQACMSWTGQLPGLYFSETKNHFSVLEKRRNSFPVLMAGNLCWKKNGLSNKIFKNLKLLVQFRPYSHLLPSFFLGFCCCWGWGVLCCAGRAADLQHTGAATRFF